jgi:hypothetical protein
MDLVMTLDELLDVKKQSYLNLSFSEEEQNTILSLVDGCEHESELSNLHKKLHFFKQYIKALLSRAHIK